MLNLTVVTDQVEKIKNEYKDNPTELSRIMDILLREYGIIDSVAPCRQALYAQTWLIPDENHAAFMEFFNKKGYVKSSNT